MKKLLALCLICCTAFAFGEDEPIFEEVDDQPKATLCIPFAADEPIFEEEEEGASQQQPKCCDEDDCPHGSDRAFLPSASLQKRATYSDWPRYKTNFGLEKLFVRFPAKPAITHSSTLLTAYAYDGAILYSLAGYYPPIGSINPMEWFDAVLYNVDRYPFSLVSRVIFQAYNGDWVMDYVAHDQFHQLIVKARAIVTPFNSYTLQCTKPIGMHDHFGYFLDNFLLKSEL